MCVWVCVCVGVLVCGCVHVCACVSHLSSTVWFSQMSPQVLLSATNDLIIREVLLDGLALNYTFHGLSAGTEYTISVTAATDAGLGPQATITATTITMQNPNATSAPGMVHVHSCSTTLQSCNSI